MQRHWDDYICFIQQAAASAIEPARETRGEVEPVGMFEREDRTAALVVIAHDGLRSVEGRWVDQTGRTKRLAARIEVEWQSATLAGRSIKEVDVLPAGSAQTSWFADLRATAYAKRRI
jgi:hypothetical protein